MSSVNHWNKTWQLYECDALDLQGCDEVNRA
jgi:hypothetical protein